MFLNVLKNKNFLTLWGSQTVAQLEARIVDLSVVVIVAEAVLEGKLGPSATALVFALQFIPALPAALLAGVVADIIDRRILLIGLNVFRSAFLILFVFASGLGPQLYVFVLVMAICMHMYDVVEKSTLKNVVTEDQIGAANGLFLLTMNGSALIGVIAAGFLTKKVGFDAVLLSGAGLYALASILAFQIPKNINNFHVDKYVEDLPVIKDTAKAVTKIAKSLKESVHYLFSTPPVWLSVILATIVQTIMLMIASVSFTFGSEVFHIETEQVTIFLLIPVALGLAVGGTLTPIFTKILSYRKVVLFAWFLASIALGIFGSIGFLKTDIHPGLSFEFILLMALIFFMGITVSLIQAPALELIQRFADPKVRGRVFGILVGATNTIAGLLVASTSKFVDILGTTKFIVATAFTLLILLGIYELILKKVLGDKDYTEYVKTNDISIPVTQ